MGRLMDLNFVVAVVVDGGRSWPTSAMVAVSECGGSGSTIGRGFIGWVIWRMEEYGARGGVHPHADSHVHADGRPAHQPEEYGGWMFSGT
eukprot:4758492-Pyramimonas_sp.AAC.1